MISTETPYKLAEIVRDTWPQIYRPINSKDDSSNRINKIKVGKD